MADDTLLDGDETLAGSRAAVTRTGARAEGSTLVAGASIGRYVVLGEEGRGAMGIVYRCYDPSLDRRVAVKLLTYRDSDSEQQRDLMIAEAQAMAKVRHPNVVSVHDAGTHQKRIYVAMELLLGPTLRQWLARAQPPLERILETFVQAAEGLAAAHQAGLIHRDFKPDNVILDDDLSRAVVLDFGLARVGVPSATSEAGEASTVSASEAEVAGTPRYMAPEQFANDDLTSAVDQFSFCVALYEAIAGKRPFEAKTLPGLAAKVTAGHVAPLERRPGLSNRVREAIVRGLRPDPAQRFATMEELIAALRPPQTPKRWLLAGGLVLAGVATAFAVQRSEDPVDRCERGSRSIDAVWGTPARERIDGQFAKLELAYADDAWRRAAKTIDAYAAGWSEIFAQACLATFERGEQSTARFDRQSDCLVAQREQVAAVLAKLEDPDPGLAQGLEAITETLPDPSRCLERQSDDEKPDARDEEARVELARIQVDRLAGQVGRAQKATAVLLDSLRPEGPAELHASVLHARAQVLRRLGQSAEAVTLLEQALRILGPTDERNLAMGIWREYLTLLATDGNRRSDAEALVLAAEIAVGGAAMSEGHRSMILLLRAGIAMRQHGPDQAIAHAEAAMELIESGVEGGNLEFALLTLSLAQAEAERFEDALGATRRLAELSRERYGEHHPEHASALRRVAYYCGRVGDLDCAAAAGQRALEIYEPLGEEVALARADVFIELGRLGGPDEAGRKNTEAALQIFREQLPKGNVRITAAASDLARRVEEARAHELLDLAEDNESVVNRPELRSQLLQQRGELLQNAGDLDGAIAAFERAIALVDHIADGQQACWPQSRLSNALREKGDPKRALTVARTAFQLCVGTSRPSSEVAGAHEAYARALVARPEKGSRELAYEQATLAISLYRDLDYSERATKLEAWRDAL